MLGWKVGLMRGSMVFWAFRGDEELRGAVGKL